MSIMQGFPTAVPWARAAPDTLLPNARLGHAVGVFLSSVAKVPVASPSFR